MSGRATVRPVTLARLVELTNTCGDRRKTTEDIENVLGVSHRRARETILEAARVGLLRSDESSDEDPTYETTRIGTEFLNEVRDENWPGVSDILASQSPHYDAFLEAVDEVQPAKPGRILERLETDHEHSAYDFNQTSIEVLGDWGERLGAIQRHAFAGTYYLVSRTQIPSNFPFILRSVFNEREESAGVNLRQRYLSIPELREATCERLRCPRSTFDDALLIVVEQNVGKVELSGAPMDTGAKEARLGIKQIDLADSGGLVSTDQSTDAVMAGVEHYGKQYYYLAIHDENLAFTQENRT